MLGKPRAGSGSLNSLRGFFLGMATVLSLALCMLCWISCVSAVSTPVDEVVSEGSLETLLFSLEKLMFFFYKRYEKLNVDGLFGIRAVEGEFQRALEKSEQGIYVKIRDNTIVREKMKKILEMATKTAELALPYVKKQDETYYQNFLPIIDKPFRSYEVQPQLVSKVNMDELPWTRTNRTGKISEFEFSEEQSDECMMLFMGKHDGQHCDWGECWELMTKLDSVLYHTTHQILWFQLGIKAGCQPEMEDRLRPLGGLNAFLGKVCNNIIFTMETISEGEVVDYIYQDIFLEQGMICGVMGFMDALRLDWLTMALRWQHPAFGCFREYEFNDVPETEQKALDERMFARKKEWRRRYLLMDIDMGDHCSAHKSAVAAGFLAIYTRLFLDPDYVENKLWPAMYGEDYISPKVARKRHIRRVLFAVSLSAFALIVILAIGPRRIYGLCVFLKRYRGQKNKKWLKV